MIVYLRSALPAAERDGLVERLEHAEWVEEVRPVSAERARQRFAEIFPSLSDLTLEWAEEPLPASLEVSLDPARLRANGVRLRCSKCEAVFRITPPPVQAETPAEEPTPAPLEQAVASGAEWPSAAAPRSEEQRRRLVLLADSEVEAGKTSRLNVEFGKK